MQWLQATAPARAVAEVWFPMVESLHVIALALLAGTIFLASQGWHPYGRPSAVRRSTCCPGPGSALSSP